MMIQIRYFLTDTKKMIIDNPNYNDNEESSGDRRENIVEKVGEVNNSTVDHNLNHHHSHSHSTTTEDDSESNDGDADAVVNEVAEYDTPEDLVRDLVSLSHTSLTTSPPSPAINS